MRRKAEQAQVTRETILRAARAVFTEKGYESTAAEEIAVRAGVTRGAFYHHFRDKKDIFALCYEILQREIQQRVLKAVSDESDTWKRLIRGCEVYLEAALDPAVQRIVLLDAPRVFTRSALTQLQAVTGSGLIGPGLMRMFLQDLMDSGVLVRQNAWAMSVLLGGALEAAALEIATAPDKQMWRQGLEHGLVALLERLRIRPEEKDRGWWRQFQPAKKPPKPKRTR